jgi:hypothetical protein
MDQKLPVFWKIFAFGYQSLANSSLDLLTFSKQRYDQSE